MHFLVVVMATFRTLYVFVIMELVTHRILHQNVDRPPNGGVDPATVLPGASRRSSPSIRASSNDRDSIFSQNLDKGGKAMACEYCAPVRVAQANPVCVRLGGSLRRECMDFFILFNERHLKHTVEEWRMHYNRGRPHSSLVLHSGIEPGEYSGHRPQKQVDRRLPYRRDVLCWAGYTANIVW